MALKLSEILLLILLLFRINEECTAVYGRIPGERYIGFLKALQEEQRAVVRGIIFDPSLTKDQARAEIEKWAHDESPLTMLAYDRAFLDYDLVTRQNERILNQRAKAYSNDGKRLDADIRMIYKNGTLSERQACDAATNAMKLAKPETLQEIGLQPIDCDRVFSNIFDRNLG